MFNPGKRPDWFVWQDPPAEWRRQHAEVPGLQWIGVDGAIVAVELHRSHWPLLPFSSVVAASMVEAATGFQPARFAGATPADDSVILRPYQAADIPWVVSRRGSVLAYQMRLGKAQPMDCRVLTPNGWRFMGALQADDEIIGVDGQTYKVTGVFPQGRKPVFRVRFSDGSSTRCCEDHLWSVNTPYRRWKKSPPRVRSLGQIAKRLRVGGFRPGHGKAGNRQHFIPVVAPVQFKPSSIPLPIPPYVLGLLLGDGGLTQPTQVRFSSTDQELLDALRFYVRPLGLDVHGRGGSCDYRITRLRAGGHPNLLLNKLRALGLMGHGSKSKFVPMIYLRATPDERLALLQGLLDTDGYCGERNVSFCTTSEQLVQAVRELAQSLGGTATVHPKQTFYTYRGKRRAGLPAFNMSISLPASMAPFRLGRKMARYDRKKFWPSRSIEAVEAVGTDTVQCISTDAPDGLYVTDDFIVTHNTAVAALAHDAHDGPLVIVGPLAARDVWRQWVERVHGVPPFILKGTKDGDADPPTGYPAYFIHYELLDAWSKFFVNAGKIGTLVLDECHLLMNRKAQRTSVAAAILAPRAERIIGLSGTPMWNRPDSMYSILHLVSPGAWGGHHAFGVQYADGQPGAHGWTFKGLSHEEEFKARLSEVVLRRTWADVRPDLPKTIPVVEPVALSIKARLAIDTAALTASLSRATTTVAGYDATLRRLLGEAKVEAAADAAQDGVRDGHKVVVWYWHNKVGDAIVRELDKRKVPTFGVRSADSADQREQQIRNFREHVGPAVLVIGIAIGGVAIDLSCSDYAVFAELDWIPLMVQQAAMRTFSPDRPHVLVILYADHPVEQKLVEVLGVKEDFANRLDLSADDIAKAVLG